MDWFLKIVRVAGVNFPGAASLVQMQAEIDSSSIAKRIEKLEDPISFLHEGVNDVSNIIYKSLKLNDSVSLDFSENFYVQYSRSLAALVSSGLISKKEALGKTIPLGINLIDPSYIMYMCNLAEDHQKMLEITGIVDRCEVGLWLDGDQLSESIKLPKSVIRAIFEIYEAKGYGVLSKTTGICRYLCKA